MKRQFFRTAVTLMLGAALCFCLLFSTGCAEEYYVENEWNYADGSIDPDHGIPDNATGVMDRIKRKGVLRVATEPYFAPYEFIDPEQLGQKQYVGADMELARLIAEKMGVELEIVPMEFTQVLPALSENQCDLTLSAIAFTPSRASAYALSKGYYFPATSASTAFVIREEDQENITSLDCGPEQFPAGGAGLQTHPELPGIPPGFLRAGRIRGRAQGQGGRGHRGPGNRDQLYPEQQGRRPDAGGRIGFHAGGTVPHAGACNQRDQVHGCPITDGKA